MIIYGIKNCDTVKKAVRFLEHAGLDYQFHDLRKDGLTAEKVQQFIDQFGVDKVINQRGTTWRKLDEAQKLRKEQDPIDLILEYPTLMKRPIICKDQPCLIGFNEEEYKTALQ